MKALTDYFIKAEALKEEIKGLKRKQDEVEMNIQAKQQELQEV
jgi:hypothetical protein